MVKHNSLFLFLHITDIRKNFGLRRAYKPENADTDTGYRVHCNVHCNMYIVYTKYDHSGIDIFSLAALERRLAHHPTHKQFILQGHARKSNSYEQNVVFLWYFQNE